MSTFTNKYGAGSGRRRGSWPRLRAISGQGRGGRRRRPACAREMETQSATGEHARGTHATRAQKRQVCMRNKTKGRATAFA
eukprot:2609001-Pleurochrysis_carterae.AAC.1